MPQGNSGNQESQKSQTENEDASRTIVVDRTRVPKRAHARQVASRVARAYQKADARLVGVARKAVPQKTLHQLEVNRSKNNGNLRFSVPIKGKKDKRFTLLVPQALGKVRHAALPLAIIVTVSVFALAGASPPSYGWTRAIGGAGNERSDSIVVDGLGNTYTVGTFQGTVDFGAAWSAAESKSSSNSGVNYDVFITKVNANGTYGWTKTISGMATSGGSLYRLTTDSTNNLYLTGTFTDTVNFANDWSTTDEKTSNGTTDIFITKINSDASYGWTHAIGGAGDDEAGDVTVDVSGALYVSGTFQGSVTFDQDFGATTDTKASNAGSKDAFVTKIDTAGEYVATHSFGGTGAEEASRLTTDSTNNLYLTGTFTDTVNFANDWSTTDEKTSNGTTDIFITKINSDASYGWTKAIGGAGDDTPTALTIDEDNTLYAGGTFASATVDFGADWDSAEVKNRAGSLDSFITKIDTTNTYQGTKIIGGATSSAAIQDIAVDADKNLFATGAFSGNVDFGADWSASVLKTATSNGFLIKILADNSFGWVATPNVGADTAEATAVTVDAEGTAYNTGVFSGTVDFGTDYDTSDSKASTSASQDVFVTKIMRGAISHTVGDAAGLTFKDENGVNLSSTGTTETNPVVYIHNQNDDTLIATIAADLTENRDWASVSGENDTVGFKSIINDAIGAPGAASVMTLYVPKDEGDTAVALCPNIETLAEVISTCAGKRTLIANSPGVAVTVIEGVEYWVIENVTDQKIGGMSVDKPRVQMSETDDTTAVTEGGATDFVEVRLDARPSDDVTVQITSNPASQLAAINDIVFTNTNWDIPVLVEVAAIDDNDIEGNHVATLGYAATSNDSAYNGTSETGRISVAITDNDIAGVQLSTSSNLVSENGDTTEVCAVLTAKPKQSVTVQFTSSNTSEVTVASSLTIAADAWNSSNNCVTVTGIDDDEVDGPKNATIRVSGITSDDSDFAGINTNDIHTVQITNQDNDTAAFIVASSGATTTEAGSSVEVCIKLTARPTANVVVPVAVSDATEGTIGATTNLTITPSAWNRNDNCVTVTGVDDNVVDGDIQYDLVTGDPTSADEVWNVLGAGDVADQTLTNLDDDEAQVVLTNGSGLAVVEGGATDTFTVVLASEPIDDSKVVVRVSPNNELSVGGGAGVHSALTFTSENWNQPQTVTVQAVDDNKVEGDHSGSIVVSIDGDTDEPSYEGLTSQNLTATITDNDVATATITTVNDASEKPETNGRFRVAFDKPNNTGHDITLSYSVAGTAVSNQHYTALTGSAVIADGEDSTDIIVSVTGRDNALLEGDKSVVVTLTSSDSVLAEIADPADATVMIFDDERAEASFAVTQNGNEEGAVSITYTVTLDTVNNTGGAITVRANEDGGTATSGEDYGAFNNALISIPNGASSGTLDVLVNDDTLFEAETETVRASISSPSLAGVTVADEADSAEATITDNDVAELSLEATTATANENPNTNGTVRVSLDKVNNTGSAAQVSYTVSGTATADSDFAALSGSVTIPDGQQHADITINTEGRDDDDMEGNETIVLTYSGNNMSPRITEGSSNSAQVTIVDDEVAGVTITATDDTTSEDGDTGKICATLASRPSHAVTILFESDDSSKVSVPSSVTVERNNWNNASANCVTATGHDDTPAAATGTQNIIIRTTDVQSDDPFYDALTGDDMQDITIRHSDNDTPGISVITTTSTTSEDGAKSATVQFRLQTQPTDDVVIPLSVSDETEGIITESQVTITPENWNTPEENEVVISGVDDYLTDGNIDYLLETGDPNSADAIYDDLTAADVDNVQLTNEDDDQAGVVIVDGGNVSVAEGGASVTIGVHLESQPDGNNIVTVRAIPADIQLDLGAGAGAAIEMEFDDQNWQTGQQVTISAFDDDLLEGGHSSSVRYEIVSAKTTEAAYDGYEITATTTAAITDNDTADATFTLSDGNEAGPVAMTTEVTLGKENNTGAPITFSLHPSGGTATTGIDYADFTNTTVSIPDGESSASVVIAVADDDLLEGDETVQATLSNASAGFVHIANASQTATITDNDTAAISIVATTPNAYEYPAQAGEFTVYLSRVNNTGAPIEVAYTTGGDATADQDYTALSDTVLIPNGASSATISASTAGHNDTQVEGSETVIATLQSANHSLVSVGSPSSATVTIIDDDSFAFNIQKMQDGSEDGANITFRVQLSQVNTTGSPVSVNINDTSAGTATANEDYQSFGGAVTIPNGQQYVDYVVEVLDDSDLEDTYETVEARISNPSEGEIGGAEATATITDNDTATATIETTTNANENPSTNGVVTITLDKINNGSQPVTMTYTVNGTATAGEDYAPLSGHAMIAPGQDSTVITVNTEGYNDDTYEGDETVVITLGSVNHPGVTIGEPGSATITIVDDDPEPGDGGDDGGETPGEGDGGSDNSGGGVTTKQPLQTQRTVYIPVAKNVVERSSGGVATEQEVESPKPQPVRQQAKDMDNDGISDEEENKAHNNGDGNGDGIPDSRQSNVASLVSSVTNSPVTLEARGECSDITKFKIVAEDSLAKQDKRHSYPYGLVDFKIACEESGDKSMLAVYYDRTLSTDNNWRKFSGNNEQFATMNFVQNVRKPVGTSNVTAVQYTIEDGDESDSDGKANSEIVDPAGFAQRSFYILDLGWLIPVIIAGGFVGYAVWHRIQNHRRYSR